ncbi:MAG TPA: alpha-amylase family glycosyl hydrolase [Rectinemataceae bacterium]|nr:alpha-amylase family glycosyl hydrolase [Rectinemataceae bacterium]
MPWWKNAVFYQIYPWSFIDLNGDGIGDLAGIESKLDYLESLGIDALWISPFFRSPMKDFGYDVADYRDVDPLFGSLDDFTSLLAAAKDRKIRIILDLVVNHSSDQHPWFVEARGSRSSPRHPWYLWVDDRGSAPNNWKAVFELGSAWHRNVATGERYLGTFTRHQPEFNWRNRELREAIYGVMEYWYERGVDGFRLDVATAYIKDERLRSNPFSALPVPDFFQKHLYDRNRPEVHEIFREMRERADRHGERVLIAEPYGQDAELASSCYGTHDDELHLAFNFDFLLQPWNAASFRHAALRWYDALPAGAWPTLTLSNHDQPRHFWRYRGRTEAESRARAATAAALLLTLRGAPFLYYGEEIGMTCVRIKRRRLRDPLGLKTWPLAHVGRDPERTPMQWDSGPQAGFTRAGTSWLPVNPDHDRKNVELQRADPDSLLNWYRSLLALRRKSSLLRCGGIRFLELDPRLLAFERLPDGACREEGSVRVLLNFGSREIRLPDQPGGRVLLGSRRESGAALDPGVLTLGSYETLILDVAGP